MSLVKIGLLTLTKIIRPEIVKATIALTWRCSHRCVTCNIWHDGDKVEELSFDEIQKIVERNKLLWCAFTGGEAFLREDIADILKLSLLKYPSVSVTTNGSTPDKIIRSVEYALKNTYNILSVNLSLDGNAEQHDAFTRREGSFGRVTETIERLIALKNKRLSLTIENLVSSVTEGGRDFVRQYAYTRGLNLAYTIEMRSDFYKNEDMPINNDGLPDVRFDRGNPFNYFYIRQAKRKKQVKCVAGQYNCAITPDGIVKPCWFIGTEAYKLRDTDYQIIPLGCQKSVDQCNESGGCWTPCEAYTTMMFRPWRIL